MNSTLRWAILAVVILAIVGLVIFKGGLTRQDSGTSAPAAHDIAPGATHAAGLPRLLELHGGDG